MMRFFSLLATGSTAIFMVFGAVDAPAQDYPAKPVTLIIPYPPGGFVDGLGRIVAKQFNTRTGGTMVVESRPGRDGIIGAYAVARADADGYTLLLGDTNPLTVAPLMNTSLPYHSMNDFTRIATMTSSNPIMLTRAESPLKTVADVVAAAKARPGKLTYGSGTVGQQLMGEMLKIRAEISMLHVPYKGGSQAMTDMLGGHIDLATTASANYINLRGKVTALGIASAARFKDLPEVPTMVELGYPGFATGCLARHPGPERNVTSAGFVSGSADWRHRQVGRVRGLCPESGQSGRISGWGRVHQAHDRRPRYAGALDQSRRHEVGVGAQKRSEVFRCAP